MTMLQQRFAKCLQYYNFVIKLFHNIHTTFFYCVEFGSTFIISLLLQKVKFNNIFNIFFHLFQIWNILCSNTFFDNFILEYVKLEFFNAMKNNLSERCQINVDLTISKSIDESFLAESISLLEEGTVLYNNKFI